MIKPGWIGFLPFGGFGNMPVPKPEEAWEIVESCARIGYKGFDNDMSQIPGDIDENYKRFTALGLTPLTVSCSMDMSKAIDGILEVIQRAKKQNIKRITAFASSIINDNATYDNMSRDIEAINKLVEILAGEGMILAYHNHYQEFTTIFNGSCAFEHMLIKCDPRLTFDLDTGWATVGGQDPVSLMKRLEGRISCIHLKDFYDTKLPRAPGVSFFDKKGFTSLGSGVVDVAGVLREMDRQGIEWGIVEQDKMRNLDKIQSLTASYLRIKESGLVE